MTTPSISDQAAGEPLRAAVEAMCAMLEEGEWAEHVASTTGKNDPLAQRLETAITDLHSELGDAIDGTATCSTAPTTGSAPALCAICKGYGRYQDGDSGTESDGYAPNIVECECAPEERIDANFDVIALTDDNQRTIEHAATKLENIGHIFAGDKESRRLAAELKALLAASMGGDKS